MPKPPGLRRSPKFHREPLLSKSDLNRFFTHRLTEQEKREAESRFASSEKDITAEIHRLGKLLSENVERERDLLLHVPNLKGVCSAIDHGQIPPRSVRDTYCDVTGYGRHVGEWYLPRDNFKEDEILILREIVKLRIERARIQSLVDFIKGKAALRGDALSPADTCIETRTNHLGAATTAVSKEEVPRGQGKAKSTPPFASLEGLKWQEISMTLISDTSVLVKARHVSERYTYAEMGFKDRRTDKPIKLWIETLPVLASLCGEISWQDPLSEEKRTRLQKDISRLRKVLRGFFHIREDPFEQYRKTLSIHQQVARDTDREQYQYKVGPGGGVKRIPVAPTQSRRPGAYKAKFTINDKRGGADKF
jgi:hypothetical protein